MVVLSKIYKAKDKLISSLSALGFSEKLSKCYLNVLDEGSLNLAEIISGKNQWTYQQTLAWIEDLLLNKLVFIDRDVVYPLNPRIAFEALGKSKLWEKKIDKHLVQKYALIGIELSRSYKHKSPVSFNKIKLAKTSQQLSSLLSEAITISKKLVFAVSKSPRLPQVPLIWTSISEKIKSGVVYKRIADFQELEEHGLEIVTRDIEKFHIDLRILEKDEITHKFYVIDDDIVVIFTPLASAEFAFKLQGQVIGNKFVNKQYKKIFNSLYSKSIPAKNVLILMRKIKEAVLRKVTHKLKQKELYWLSHLIDYGCFARFTDFSIEERTRILKKIVSLGYVEIRNLPSGKTPIFSYPLTFKEIRKECRTC